MFTVTANTILPCTITGSWPRPRWFDMSMWGRPIDTCMMDTRFREKFQDALAVVLSDQERAGIDVRGTITQSNVGPALKGITCNPKQQSRPGSNIRPERY
jgi:methionine synthase II (cobalamin-independent)